MTYSLFSCRVFTLGCKVNQYESERLQQGLAQFGIFPAQNEEQPDICIINTCGVTGTSEKKSRQMVRRALAASPSAVVIVTGCYVDLNGGELAGIDGACLVIPNTGKEDLPGKVAEMLGVATLPSNGFFARDRTRALLKVQDGCDAFCTYCAVPYARGAPTSRPLPQVVQEALDIAASGCREIVLTGVHLGKYGQDGGGSLEDLVEAVLDEVPLVRLRLSSLEVGELTSRLLDLMEKNPRLCRHLHLPLQSGSDPILEQMGRPYNAEYFASAATKATDRLPGLAITTDAIVGFPGETDEDFLGTVRLVERLGLARLHVFPFSARPGVPAAGYPDQIPTRIKRERGARLRRVGRDLEQAYQRRFLGKSMQVIVEEQILLSGETYLAGHTDNYLKVLFPGPENLVGESVLVESERITDAGVIGKLGAPDG